MADLTTFQNTARTQRQNDVGLYNRNKTISVVSASAAQNDTLQLIPINRACRLVDAWLQHSATLGASCTATLRRNRGGTRTAITAATTAGAASAVSATKPIDLAVDDVIEVLISGA